MTLIETAVGTLHVQCIGSQPSQAATASEWNRLAGEVPFRQAQWCATWWQHYQNNHRQSWVLTVRNDAGELVGLVPWFIEHSPLRGRVVQFLGAGEVCSDYLGIVARDEQQSAVAEAVAAWLAHDAAGRWDLLHLDGVAADDVGMQTLTAQLEQRGHTVDRRTLYHTWVLDLPTDWDAYVRSLSRSRRERVRQWVRNYFDCGRAVPRLIETSADLEHYWPIFCALHQDRRQSLGEEGCFASSEFTSFHHDIMQQLLAQGALRLHFVEYDGAPITVEYSITSGDTVYFYQSGFDPDYAEHSPGRLNLISSIRLAIEQGYRKFDFLRGDEPYKKSWRAAPRPLTELRIVGNTPSARLRYQLHQTAAHSWHRLRDACQRFRPQAHTAPPSATH